MDWKTTVTIAVVAGLVGGFAAGLVGGNQSDQFGGTRFPNGISADSTSPTAGQVRGTTLTTTGAGTIGGAATLSSTLTVTDDVTFDTTTYFMDASANRNGFGTTTPLDLGHFENSTATSTLIISSGGSAVGGRIILEDHDGAGCSEIAILNGTVAAKTVTCPTGI